MADPSSDSSRDQHGGSPAATSTTRPRQQMVVSIVVLLAIAIGVVRATVVPSVRRWINDTMRGVSSLQSPSDRTFGSSRAEFRKAPLLFRIAWVAVLAITVARMGLRTTLALVRFTGLNLVMSMVAPAFTELREGTARIEAAARTGGISLLREEGGLSEPPLGDEDDVRRLLRSGGVGILRRLNGAAT